MVINDGYRLAPLADALYACDFAWWQAHDGVPGFRGLKFTQDARVPKAYPDVVRVPSVAEPGLCLEGPTIHQGANSGYQAINLALHLGARRIVLLGYDMKPAPDGRLHWHGAHGDGLNNPDESNLRQWRKAFDTVGPDLDAAGVTVINATPDTALDCFRKEPLHVALADG